jgi:hypothetical protein
MEYYCSNVCHQHVHYTTALAASVDIKTRYLPWVFFRLFKKEIQIIIKRRTRARPEAEYYVDLVRRLIIVLYENCTNV